MKTIDGIRTRANLFHPTDEELEALLQVAEAADEFWVGANDVMTTSHLNDIGDSYEALRDALVRLDALTERT